MHRRRFLLTSLAGALATPLAADAQPADKVVRVGYLATDLVASSPVRDAFVQGLRDVGRAEGRNLVMEYRDGRGKPEQFPTLAAELVATKVDVIVTSGGSAAALAAKGATRTLPIVFNGVGDPVADGLVRSLARPGGNATGLSLLGPDLVGKQMEMLKQAVPAISRVALLYKPDAAPDRTMKRFLKTADDTARALEVRLQLVEVRSPADFDRAFADMSTARADGLVVLATPVFAGQRHRIADLATKRRLPTSFLFREYVDAGGLVSYGPDLLDIARRTATYVDKILKGAKPADLPVEQPNKFELVINLKTAKALGLTIPPSLLARADHQVIE